MLFLETKAGGRLSYQQLGSGRPLLFIHGWCMSGQVWQQQQALADQYRVVIVDLRGHGYSTVPAGGMQGFAGYGADLVDLMETLDLQHVVLVGWSLGAQVLLKVYARVASRLAGMVLGGGYSAVYCGTALSFRPAPQGGRGDAA